jgi:sugar lactone lactonase YvrE
MFRNLRAVVCLFLVALGAHAQSIVTVAGGGSDDGQQATSIALFGPRGLALDSKGRLYVVERFQGIIRRIDLTTGTVETIAGNGAAGFGGDNGPARKATLKEPRTIFIDAADNIYIADSGNGRVRRIDAKTGIITTIAGRGSERSDNTIGDNGQATEAVLRSPWGIWIDRGNLYITEAGFEGQRVRKVVLSTGVITTIAGPADGTPGSEGDGGPATAAKFNNPLGIIADSAGNLYVADSDNHRVRRIDAATSNISTYAGGGTTKGDGGLATAADIDFVTVFAFDRTGNLLIDSLSGIRRVDKSTNVISTLAVDFGISYGLVVDAAGNLLISSDGYAAILKFTSASTTDFTIIAGEGTYVGDGLPATAGILRSPQGLATDASGNLYIADSANLLVRRVDITSGLISTVAGNGFFYDNGENNKPALDSPIYPYDLAFDANGDLYIADGGNLRIKKLDVKTGILNFFAGSGDPADPNTNNEGVTALQAKFARPVGISFDATGNLYVADSDANKVWKIDAATKTVSTFAGNGKEEYTGDGGAATAAGIRGPRQVVFDGSGNAYISDSDNGLIRKVTPGGTISTFAGGGSDQPPFGDGGPASQSSLAPGHLAIDRTRGRLYVTDTSSSRLRVIDLTSSTISTVAGSGTFSYIDADFSGDNGPAKDARLNFPFNLSGVAVDRTGNLFIADSNNNRVRGVFACVPLAPAQITAPANGAININTTPSLSWSSVPAAFRYDVRLDTFSLPARVIASDVTETTFTPSNLTPGTKYFWSVTAKSDPFCPSLASAVSAIVSFTTASVCGAGAFDLTSPADGASGPVASLQWQPSSGAATYDLYLGTASPPPLFESGITTMTHTVPDIPGRIFWFVVAHAACDATKTAATPIRSFTASAAPPCGSAASVTQISPANGASDVATSVDLTWSVTQVNSTVDVYFGTSTTPPLLRSGIPATTTSLTLPSLDAGVTYYWRVVAACTNPVSTPVASFTTRTLCTAPGSTQIIFAPSSVSTGATYTIVWSVAAGLDVDGGYLVERSTSSSFSPILDSQVTSSGAASFVAAAPVTYFHRVRAIPACDPTRSGAVSDAKSVTVTNAPSNIIFTVQPAAQVTSLGEKLEDRRATFTLENIGATPAQIIVGQSELPGSKPFFSIAEGGAFIALQPRVPRTFTIQYSGPPNNVAASYQGVIFAVGVTQQLAVTPYAFVNLKVGGAPATAPQFVIDGTPGDYVAFPGFAGDDDSARAGRDITIRNTGTTVMELAAEVGPDVWLIPENGWNSQPLVAGASRTFKLRTQRPFAPSGSPLPRYTYFTVRTKDGASARLLVQDNDRVAVTNGRAIALDVSARTFIIPEVISLPTAAGRTVTRMRLTNSGGDSVQVELLFTPSGVDGFDASAIKRAVVVVPPNDVVTLTDPLLQVFSDTTDTLGQIEVRVPRERLGLIAVTASTLFLGSGTTAIIPVVTRSDGARIGNPHVIYVPAAANVITTLTLAETSGVDKASVRFVADGGQTLTVDVPRYSMKRMNLNATTRVEIDVDSGGGSVIGLVTLTSGSTNATVLSRPLNERATAGALAQAFWKTKPDAGTPSVTTVVPVISGSTSAGNSPAYKTSIGLVAQSSAVVFNASFYPGTGGAALVRSVTVGAGQTTVFGDVMKDLFAVATPSDGNLFIVGPTNGKVYAVLQSTSSSGVTAPASSMPLPTNLSEALTSATSSAQRPLFLDGLEQSVDPTRGTRWILLLNEVGSASGFVNVRLYEAGNRSRPIAEKDLAVAPNQQLKLDTLFRALGLDAADRQKDRTNVELVVTATAGSARVAASAVSIDNQTGDTKMYGLAPVIGSGNPNVQFAAPVVTPQPPSVPARRRSVRH